MMRCSQQWLKPGMVIHRPSYKHDKTLWARRFTIRSVDSFRNGSGHLEYKMDCGDWVYRWASKDNNWFELFDDSPVKPFSE